MTTPNEPVATEAKPNETKANDAKPNEMKANEAKPRMVSRGTQTHNPTKPSRNLLYAAVKTEDRAFLYMLLKDGADLNGLDSEGRSLLIDLVIRRETQSNISISPLLEFGIDMNIQDNKGMTALMHACKKADDYAVRQLLAWNRELVEVNLKDKEGKTALMHIPESNPNLVKVLIDAGASFTPMRRKEPIDGERQQTKGTCSVA
jgi:ankyrin repeat protein